MRARVLLADDHQDFLAATARFLEPEFEVVEAVGNGRALVEGRRVSTPTYWSSISRCRC